MADCVKCGNKAGMRKTLCDACARKENELRAEQAAKERARQRELEQERQIQMEAAREKRWAEFVDVRLAALEETLRQGITPYLYRVIGVEGLSYFHDSPNPNSWKSFTQTRNVGTMTNPALLQQLGWQGWELVGVLPITFGASQYNTAGGNTIHASAYAGLVVGAQLLLRLPITTLSLSQNRTTILEHLELEFPG